MADYDFTTCLSPLDFELLSKDLLEAELGIHLENFSEGRDKGIDLRYAPLQRPGNIVVYPPPLAAAQRPPRLIVQCKRYSTFASLKSELKHKELPKIAKLKPDRYVLTTSVSLSPQQVDDLMFVLSPFVQSTGDVFGRERLNSILTKHHEIERRHIKLWVRSAGVLDSILNAGTHIVSREEIERTIAAARIYVRNRSFDEALAILKQHHVCIISGLPGIGKTTLARMLLLYFYDRDFNVVKIESDISEARAVGYHNKPRFYYYDDFLGQTAQADKLNKNEDQKLLDFIASIRDSKDSLLVLTTREYILNQARLHYEKLAREKFDHRTCTIDLSKYSRRIRAQILYNHLHFSDLPRAHLEALVAERGYVRIVDHRNYNPRLIEYLTNPAWVGNTPPKEYFALFLRNLDNPVEIWGHAFRSQLSDRARHLLLILPTLPTESRLTDAERAFTAFHTAQCEKCGIAHRPTDFREALKELDGTFVATRKVQETVLVSLQNPSIRDFMQNVLLDGELLPDVIASCVFFEQAHWLIETLTDKESQMPRQELTGQASGIVSALQRLAGADSCSFSVERYQACQRITPQRANPAARLATTAQAISSQQTRQDSQWVRNKMIELAGSLAAGQLSPSSCLAPIETLWTLGHLESEQGKQLVLALKSRAMSEPSDLDDFETLANLIDLLPESFAEAELATIRAVYSEFADWYAAECGLTSPDELREEASRVGSVGNRLSVDTNAAQESLRETATEIESEDAYGWDDDDDGRGGHDPEQCSDAELDSMFGTLGD